ncbi:MAG: DUF2752 domain-containing protein [Planctomycetes bacterium]|nr:DUF2752 domain-containing protein [Planctomycetota bacterium]
MNQGQQLNNGKFFVRVPIRQRFIASGIFIAIAAVFVLFFFAADGKINLDKWLTPCGFKQRHNLPCPTCGFTAAALAFAKGEIFKAFYIQPAAALFYSFAAIGAIGALFTAVFGLYLKSLKRLCEKVKTRYVIIAIAIIIAAGWAVSLLRAINFNNGKL